MSAGSKGWVCLHRQIADHWLWNDKPFSKGQAWIDLILLANHDTRLGIHEGKKVTFERGTVNRSILSLSERWGWDRKKTKRFLGVLEMDGMVSVNSTTHGTTITIIKYGFFQCNGTTDDSSNDQPIDQPMGNQWDINNNDKQLNNVNNIDMANTQKPPKPRKKNFIAPTVEDVSAYCRERNNNIDPEHFIDYYTTQGWTLSNGRKMVDWKGAVRRWEKNNKDWHGSARKDNEDELNRKQRQAYEPIF